MEFCNVLLFPCLQGGGIVRFFHRTHECYIVAEGSFAGSFSSVEAIKDLVESRSHKVDPEPESSLFMRADTESEFSIDTAYLDTPLDEQCPSILDSHIQQVEVEIHESTDRGDSELQCPPLSSIRSYKLNRAGSVFSSHSSVRVTDRLATLQKISSLTLDLTDGQDQQIVTDDGEWSLSPAVALLRSILYLLNDYAVHFRRRRSNHGVLKYPSTSANTFWQIEKCLDSRSGT